MNERSKHHRGSAFSSLRPSGCERYWFQAVDPEQTILVRSFISSSVKESGIPIGLSLSEVGAAKTHLVLVLSFNHALSIQWLENNLGGSSSQIEHGSSRPLFPGTDVSKQVVGSNPGIHAFVAAIHDRNSVSLDNREWIVVLQMTSHFRKNSRRFLLSKQSETCGGLDSNWCARLLVLWHGLERNLEKLVQRGSSFDRVGVKRGKTWFFHLKLLVQ
ncbi:hypothetical protein OGATHE_005354 [Ogataea polymorpha]|uniref:Uncharacterized protein n=1 Tax=Ogataea polymorpha TaxID=460523 RepID=A0A9P8NWR6_9ASCO|nr:hypothetical protein OGATHE_005354 [Ogataea polymorpha]